jgi:LPS export ABC transporter protein LptC/lipopolysaccharide transport protein LptA
MKRLRKILGFIVLILIAGIVFAVYVRYQERDEEAVPEGELTAESDVASVEATEIKYTESEGGKTLWEIEAKEAKFFKDKAKSEFEGIHVRFFYQDDYELVLSGNHGVLNTDTKNMTISDNVTIALADDYVLKTDTLNYSTDNDEITTEDPVTVSGPEISFSGRGLTFNLDTEELFIHDDVSTTFSGSGDTRPMGKKDEAGFDDLTSFEGPLTINSNGFYGNRDRSLVRYTDGAVAIHKDGRLRASSITIYFKGVGGDIKKVEARGNVRLVRTDIEAECGLLVFDYDKKILSLEKHPVIRRGDDLVTGDKILYYLDEKKSVAMSGEKERAHVTIHPEEDF